MRLDEVVAPPTRIEVSDVFKISYEEYRKLQPDLVPSSLLKFCESKLKNEPVTGTDGILTHSKSRYIHYHARAGIGILIYKRVGNTLRFYDMVRHAAYDTPPALKKTETRLNNLDDSKFQEINPTIFFTPPIQTHVTISDEDKEEIEKIINELVKTQAFEIIKPIFDRNDWKNLLEFIRLIDPNIDQAAIFAAFSGVRQLKKLISNTIRKFDLEELFQKYHL